jgi:methionyl-tRNA formyltransferase
MRGFTPWPGAFTEFRGQTCHLAGRPSEAQPQEVKHQPLGTLLLHGGKLLVVCGTATLLEVSHVKLEGRRQVSAAEFANGARLQTGERFGKS